MYTSNVCLSCIKNMYTINKLYIVCLCRGCCKAHTNGQGTKELVCMFKDFIFISNKTQRSKLHVLCYGESVEVRHNIDTSRIR